MSGGRGWWILVQAPVTRGGDSTLQLIRTIPVDGGRDQAVDQAAEVARTCSDAGYKAREPEAYGRRVFRAGETVWLVETSRSHWSDGVGSITSTSLVQVSVAELEYEHETPLAEQPDKKGVLRRALGKD